MIDKIYHIYNKDKCIFHSLKENEFKEKWEELNRLSEFLSDENNLSYEEIAVNREIILNSSY